MVLHVSEYIFICVCNDESVFKHVNHSTNVEVLWSVEYRLIGEAVRLGNSRPFQEFAANDSGIPDWRFVDRHHVIGQAI